MSAARWVVLIVVAGVIVGLIGFAYGREAAVGAGVAMGAIGGVLLARQG